MSMIPLGSKLVTQECGYTMFRSPACMTPHALSIAPSRWNFNGDGDKPTFTPSVLVTHDAVPGAGPGFEEYLTARACHSFITGGRIQFLGACTHALAGQTVDLPDWRPAWAPYGGSASPWCWPSCCWLAPAMAASNDARPRTTATWRAPI